MDENQTGGGEGVIGAAETGMSVIELPRRSKSVRRLPYRIKLQ